MRLPSFSRSHDRRRGSIAGRFLAMPAMPARSGIGAIRAIGAIGAIGAIAAIGAIGAVTSVGAPLAAQSLCGSGARLEILAISSLQQIAREPGVRVSLAPEWTISNPGDAALDYFTAIAPAPPWAPIVGLHPVYSFQLYSFEDGGPKLVGTSDVFHDFFATNTGCGGAGGQTLDPGCQTTISTSSSYDSFYYGPRSEVTPPHASWSSFGSHFDVTAAEPTPDDFRSHDGETDGFTHRLVASEPEMLAATELVLEITAFAPAGAFTTSAVAHRPVTATPAGIWTFAFSEPMVAGPAVASWGAITRTQTIGTGSVASSANAVDLGGGLWAYDWALTNIDSSRAPDLFEVHFPLGSDPANVRFSDGDGEPLNDWTYFEDPWTSRWTAPAPTADLAWGRTVRFGFDMPVPPTNAAALIEAHDSSLPDVSVEIDTRGPMPGAPQDIFHGDFETGDARHWSTCDPP